MAEPKDIEGAQPSQVTKPGGEGEIRLSRASKSSQSLLCKQASYLDYAFSDLYLEIKPPHHIASWSSVSLLHPQVGPTLQFLGSPRSGSLKEGEGKHTLYAK